MMIISFQTWEGLVPLQKWGMEEEKEGGSGEGDGEDAMSARLNP